MKMLTVNRKIVLPILMMLVLVDGLQGVSYADHDDVGDVVECIVGAFFILPLFFGACDDDHVPADPTLPAADPTLPAVTDPRIAAELNILPATEATLHEIVVTLTLSGGTYVRFRQDIADALAVSGIPGVTIGKFNRFGQVEPAWFGVDRVSDTRIEVELGAEGVIDTDATLTFTVGAGAIANYNGPAVTAEVRVPAQVRPDLVIDSPQINKSTLAPGETFTLSATVRNTGDGRSVGTTLRYYRSTDNRILSSDTQVGTDSVSALGANRTSQESVTLTAPTPPGTYYYGACVGSVTRESNTNNNCSTAVKITVQSIPAELVISSENNQKGTPNSKLTAPLIVRVLDDNGKGVADVRVIFRVTAGKGRLTSRANGRAVAVSTNPRGFAEATFTPTSAGTLTIQASAVGFDPVTFTVNAGPPPAKLVKVSGDTQHGKPGTRLAHPFAVEVQDKDGTPIEGITVTFRVTAGGGKLSATTVTTGKNGRAQTFLTLGTTRAVNQVQASVSGIDTPVTFRTSIEAIVLIAANQRPPMYWVDADAGTLHRLVGSKVENLLPSVQNATSLAVDMINGKLYWTEKTGERTGRIRRANLDGSNVQLVKDLTSAPLYLAVDTAGGKLYLINAWNKIQRMNLNGSGFQPNLITGLMAPKGLAVDAAGGKVYWIEQTGERSGRIRGANLDGSNVQLMKALTSVPGGLAIDTVNGKLYITNAYGKVQRLNFNGSGFQPNLITGLKSPMDLAVDGAEGKVYWTEQGSLRRANLTGENITDVVTGLGTVSSLVLGTPPVNNGGPAAPTAIASVSGETALLANYPNPFNPETWIPYQLETSAEVTLTIYAVDGQAVRQLELGHQAPGTYQTRSRAAYWDGRNEYGEPVASGLYFYTLTAGEFSATRKMLIRK